MPVSFEQRYPGAGEEEGEDDIGEGGAEADDFRRKNRFKQVKFCLAHLLPCQALLLCLLLRFSRYELRADASLEENGAPAALGGGVGRTETEHLLRNFTFQVTESLFFAIRYVMPVLVFGGGGGGRGGGAAAAPAAAVVRYTGSWKRTLGLGFSRANNAQIH